LGCNPVVQIFDVSRDERRGVEKDLFKSRGRIVCGIPPSSCFTSSNASTEGGGNVIQV
jgi:hypothetical protein